MNYPLAEQAFSPPSGNYVLNLINLATNYDIPLEAVVKSDLLRLGFSFTPQALAQAAQYKEKSYFIFSFDMVEQQQLSETERHAAPEEIALTGGPHELERTIVSVRLNPSSPYAVTWSDGEFVLYYGQERISECILPERPSYYQHQLSSGKPVSDIAPTIEWGYLIYLTAFRICQYWGDKEECQFCDINANFRQQKKERSYTGVKDISEVLEAFQIIHDNDPQQNSKAYTVTGGSVTRELNGYNEGEFYALYAREIEKRFPGRWLPKAVVQALPLDEVRLLHDSGYKIYHPNYEVWDERLFHKLCPGKTRYVGRDEWIKRIIDAAEVFGAENVIPNFVAGIEMSSPHGFSTVPEAIKSTAEGLEYFMSHGVLPRFTVWCIEPNTVLSKTNNEPPPLEYFVALLQVYRDLFRKFEMPEPSGYGPTGVGRAVFSVSAFMDVL